jgi:hypothetical protein|tara:strand:+ start:233 stop:463 length:231 start_codon:yes stop_codon:yes gene_type:complete
MSGQLKKSKKCDLKYFFDILQLELNIMRVEHLNFKTIMFEKTKKISQISTFYLKAFRNGVLLKIKSKNRERRDKKN